MEQPSEHAIVSTLVTRGDKFVSLVNRFVAELPVFITNIKQAFEALDNNALKHEVHRLKGVSGNYGFPQLSELCKELETYLKDTQHDKISGVLAKIDYQVKAIQNGIKKT